MNNFAKTIIMAIPPRILDHLNGALLPLICRNEDTRKLIRERWDRVNATDWGKRIWVYVWPGRPCPEEIRAYENLLIQLKPKRILILGTTPELRDLACTMTKKPVAIADLSLVMFHEMARFLKKADIYQEQWYFADWLSLPVPDASFDLVMGDSAIKQVIAWRRSALVGEINRVLRPGGFFLARDHYINPRWCKVELDDIVQDLSVRGFTAEEMRLILLFRLYDRWIDPDSETFSYELVEQDQKTLVGLPSNSLIKQVFDFDVATHIQEIITSVMDKREWTKISSSRRWSPKRAELHRILSRHFRLIDFWYDKTRGEDSYWNPLELFQKNVNHISKKTASRIRYFLRTARNQR